MLDFVLRPIAAYLASTLPDPSPQVAKVSAMTGETTLWAGALLGGDALVSEMAETATFGVTTLLFAAFAVACGFGARQTDPGKQLPKPVPTLFTIVFGSMSLLSACFAYSTYDDHAESARTVVAITPTQVVTLVDGQRKDMPNTAVASIIRQEGGDCVIIRFVGRESLNIRPASREASALPAAVDRLVREAGGSGRSLKDRLG